jgi:hypothetical protein
MLVIKTSSGRFIGRHNAVAFDTPYMACAQIFQSNEAVEEFRMKHLEQSIREGWKLYPVVVLKDSTPWKYNPVPQES